MKTDTTASLVVAGVVLGIGVLAWLGFRLDEAQARRRAAERECAYCLHALYQASRFYAEDHGGRFPSKWQDIVTNYIGRPDVFHCETAGKTDGAVSNVADWADFVLIPGRTTNDAPASVLALEPLANHHRRGGNVLFVNGDIRWLRPSDYGRLNIGK